MLQQKFSGFCLFIFKKQVHLWGSRKPYRVGKDLIFTNMKKLMYGGIAIASLMTVIVACQKENVVPNATTTAATQKTSSSFDAPQEKTGGGNLREWFDDHKGNVENINFGCRDGNGNCLPTATVSPSQITDANDFGNHIVHGSSAEDVHTFDVNKAWLLTFMDASDYIKVMNHTYTVDVRGSVSSSGNMYIVLKRNNGVQVVYPVGS
jgi:hypothetical protein